MIAEIINVGTELLLGDIINTNAAYLSRELKELGIFCYYQSVVGDNVERFKELLRSSIQRSDLVIITGGLGPTYDDMTKESVAQVLGKEMVFHPETYERIKDIFRQSKRELTENNKKQAYRIEGSEVLINHQGTAPGLYLEDEQCTIILLPGPPNELRPMFEKYVIPKLKESSDLTLVSKNIYMTGIGESQVEDILNKEMSQGTNPTIAPYAFIDGLVVRVTASAQTERAALELINPIEDKIVKRFKKYVYSVDMPLIEEVVVDLLRGFNLKVSVAESCTGGLLAQRITSIPGSSSVFDLGVVTYSNQQKIDLLNVDSELIKEVGAVSEEVVREMATNVQILGQADYGLAISGVAGPDSSEQKPVGLVYIGVATKDEVVVKKLELGRGYHNDRQRIRQLSSTYLMKLLIDLISSDSKLNNN